MFDDFESIGPAGATAGFTVHPCEVSNWRMKLQAEDTEYERSRFEKTKRNIKVSSYGLMSN